MAEWRQLRRTVFAVSAHTSLAEQVRAGLSLYRATAFLCDHALLLRHRPLIVDFAVGAIEREFALVPTNTNHE